MSKSASSDPSPKETSSLNLHQQERSNQADATSIDDMHTVYCHTHSIFTTSNVRANEWGQSGRWTGLLERVASICPQLQFETHRDLLPLPHCLKLLLLYPPLLDRPVAGHGNPG